MRMRGHPERTTSQLRPPQRRLPPPPAHTVSDYRSLDSQTFDNSTLWTVESPPASFSPPLGHAMAMPYAPHPGMLHPMQRQSMQSYDPRYPLMPAESWPKPHILQPQPQQTTTDMRGRLQQGGREPGPPTARQLLLFPLVTPPVTQMPPVLGPSLATRRAIVRSRTTHRARPVSPQRLDEIELQQQQRQYFQQNRLIQQQQLRLLQRQREMSPSLPAAATREERVPIRRFRTEVGEGARPPNHFKPSVRSPSPAKQERKSREQKLQRRERLRTASQKHTPDSRERYPKDRRKSQGVRSMSPPQSSRKKKRDKRKQEKIDLLRRKQLEREEQRDERCQEHLSPEHERQLSPLPDEELKEEQKNDGHREESPQKRLFGKEETLILPAVVESKEEEGLTLDSSPEEQHAKRWFMASRGKGRTSDGPRTVTTTRRKSRGRNESTQRTQNKDAGHSELSQQKQHDGKVSQRRSGNNRHSRKETSHIKSMMKTLTEKRRPQTFTDDVSEEDSLTVPSFRRGPVFIETEAERRLRQRIQREKKRLVDDSEITDNHVDLIALLDGVADMFVATKCNFERKGDMEDHPSTIRIEDRDNETQASGLTTTAPCTGIRYDQLIPSQDTACQGALGVLQPRRDKAFLDRAQDQLPDSGSIIDSTFEWLDRKNLDAESLPTKEDTAMGNSRKESEGKNNFSCQRAGEGEALLYPPGEPTGETDKYSGQTGGGRDVCTAQPLPIRGIFSTQLAAKSVKWSPSTRTFGSNTSVDGNLGDCLQPSWNVLASPDARRQNHREECSTSRDGETTTFADSTTISEGLGLADLAEALTKSFEIFYPPSTNEKSKLVALPTVLEPVHDIGADSSGKRNDSKIITEPSVQSRSSASNTTSYSSISTR